MIKPLRTVLVLFLVPAVLLGACIPAFQPVASVGQLTPDQSLVETAAAGAVEEFQTQVAVETLVAQLTVVSKQLSDTATATLVPDTATPTPTLTVTPLPTSTPTATAWVWPYPAGVSRGPFPSCYAIDFEGDISIPDGTVLVPNQDFRKTWRLKNVGSCTWTSDFVISFHSGTQMGAPDTQALGVDVLPGQAVDVSMDMVAPAAEGSYTGYFWMRSSDGVSFGWGPRASSPFWVKIVVRRAPVPPPTGGYNPGWRPPL